MCLDFCINVSRFHYGAESANCIHAKYKDCIQQKDQKRGYFLDVAVIDNFTATTVNSYKSCKCYKKLIKLERVNEVASVPARTALFKDKQQICF